MRIAPSILISLVLSFLLSACGNLPQPFQGAERNDAILNKILANRSVMVAPIIGPPPPINQKIAQDIAIAAQEKDVVAVTRGGNTDENLLQGVAQAITDEFGNTHLEFKWSLTDPAGFQRGSFISQVPAFSETANDPWLLYANSDLRPLVEEVSQFLARELVDSFVEPPVPPANSMALGPPPLREQGTATQDNTQQAQQPPYQVYVGQITGAPGNGNEELGEAMRLLLSPGNILIPLVLNEGPNEATYIINARVNRTRLSPTQEAIQLIWQLSAPSGEVLGTVDQENQISRGSLDGSWGDTAFYAVEGAAEGLLRLLLGQEPLALPPSTSTPSQEPLRGSLE